MSEEGLRHKWLTFLNSLLFATAFSRAVEFNTFPRHGGSAAHGWLIAGERASDLMNFPPEIIPRLGLTRRLHQLHIKAPMRERIRKYNFPRL